MAVSTKIEDLKSKCEELGLKVTAEKKKFTKKDYIRSLREYYLPDGGLQYNELTPMLCFPSWNLDPDDLDKIWDDDRWVVQKKLNGCRVILHFVAGVGVFAHTRNMSVKTFRYEECTDHLLFKDESLPVTVTLDTEAVIEKSIDTRKYTTKGTVTKSSLHSTVAALHLDPAASRQLQKDQDARLVFHVFDITTWDEVSLTKNWLDSRLLFVKSFQELIENEQNLSQHFAFPEVVYGKDKRAFFEQVIADGGEGVILKHRESIYHDSSSRSRHGWLKVKKSMEYDAFVTGFVRGKKDSKWENMVGGLVFSVFTEDGTTHEIATCASMDLEMRERISIYDAEKDEVSLSQDMYNRVAQVSGQDISSRSYRLSHAVIDRWRDAGADGKKPAECIVSMADLKKAASWVA